jgi:ubiquinone/menaquinone biosynthesis C-methylase UbiE
MTIRTKVEGSGYDLSGVNDYAVELDESQIASGVHRQLVGGMWDEIGRLQFEFMRNSGLTPDDSLLDIGCGSLRGGVHFIRYLNPGRYVGVDANLSLLRAGEMELAAADLQEKDALLVHDATFRFETIQRSFRFALAQSLFTHLFFNNIARCLSELAKVMERSGRLFATFFQAPRPQFIEPLQHEPGGVTTYFDRNPFHASAEELRWLADHAGFDTVIHGAWNHPRGQRMAVFSRR